MAMPEADKCVWEPTPSTRRHDDINHLDDLPETGEQVLSVLRDHDEVTSKQLADVTGLSQTGVRSGLAALYDLGVLASRHDPLDPGRYLFSLVGGQQ